MEFLALKLGSLLEKLVCDDKNKEIILLRVGAVRECYETLIFNKIVHSNVHTTRSV